jgi:LCP family protein required for cell wall assembly
LLGSSGGSLIAGKVGYAVSCILAVALLVASGVAYHTVSLVNGFGGGIMLGHGGSSTGAMNILVMGLESRTDFQGRPLDHHMQVVLHSGNQGGQATNTLILLHIFAGGDRAVGFSIPRDDWVTYPQTYDGQTQGKIDQAYGFAYFQSLNETVNSGKSNDERYLEANKAGQAATVATVEAVTGQQIDHFAEVNLAGYYLLAQAFGGVTVCVKPWTAGNDQNLADRNSGWDAVADGYNKAKGGTQYLHLSAAQALAYVRDRDTLPNGDLDRTHRQQAVLDFIIWKLEHDGILSSVGQLTALLNTAKSILITDQDWNLLDFSTNMKALTGKNLQFYTAPIVTYQTINGQSANLIDIPTIQAAIKEKFSAPAPGAKPSASASAGKAGAKAPAIPPASSVTVDVYNGGSAQGLATGISQALVAKGYKAGAVTNSAAQTKTPAVGTQVFYGKGTAANAAKIADYFGATPVALSALPAGHVEVLLGTGATVVPSGLEAKTSTTPSSTTAAGIGTTGPGTTGTGTTGNPTTPATTAGNNGAAGGAVTVGAQAKYGVPCIY